MTESRKNMEGAAPRGGPAKMSVAEAIARRSSCRAYKPDPVPQEHLERLLEAARLAPSACNKQPWRFAVVRNPSLRARIVNKTFLPGIKMPWALEAPVFVVIGMERAFVTHRLGAVMSGVNYPWMDIGIAGEHLVLAATELGLGTCWIGWIRSSALARVVGWPRTVKAVAVITVGFPAEESADRAAPTRRKSLDELTRWL